MVFRHTFGTVSFQRHLKQWMTGLAPVDDRLGHHLRFKSPEFPGEQSLGTYEVDVGEKLVGFGYLAQIWPDKFRHILQDTYDFAAFVGFEFAYSVVCLNYISRLYIYCASGGGFVVYDTTHLLLHRREDGDDKTSVAYGGRDIFFDDSIVFCRSEDRVQGA